MSPKYPNAIFQELLSQNPTLVYTKGLHRKLRSTDSDIGLLKFETRRRQFNLVKAQNRSAQSSHSLPPPAPSSQESYNAGDGGIPNQLMESTMERFSNRIKQTPRCQHDDTKTQADSVVVVGFELRKNSPPMQTTCYSSKDTSVAFGQLDGNTLIWKMVSLVICKIMVG